MAQTFVNVGAVVAADGTRVSTKKKLKELVDQSQDEDQAIVGFDQTALQHNGRVPRVATVEDIPVGVTLNVCGPDPYNDRRWYAEVYRHEASDRVVVK